MTIAIIALPFLAAVWGLCIFAGHADARQDPADEHGEWLGVGGAIQFHDDAGMR